MVIGVNIKYLSKINVCGRRSKMEAREQAFYFMQATMCVEIPFFQRGYVWN